MAMSRRKDRARTPDCDRDERVAVTGGHPFYQRLNQVLDTHAFDAFVNAPRSTPRQSAVQVCCRGPKYFEGIDSERGIAWRTADSLALRGFLGLDLDEALPEHWKRGA